MAPPSPAAGDPDEGSDDEVEHDVKAWVAVQVAAECTRAQGLGQRVLRLAVKNCGLVRRDEGIVNRVEVDTGFNFDTVKQILLSDPIPVPCKPGYALRHLVLSTGKPLVVLLPYVYDTTVSKNSFGLWEFQNNKAQASTHQVNVFE